MRRLILGLILLFVSVQVECYAYDKYTSKRITTLDGLSQNNVADLIQDSYGFVWVATNDGVCRYDGYEFRTFSIGDWGLGSNLILSLVEDRRGNIWIGTADKGLYCYIRSDSRMYHYTELADEPSIVPLQAVRYLTLSSDGSIWGYDSRSRSVVRVRFNQKEQRIKSIELHPFADEGFNVTSIHTTKTKVYIGTNRGLYQYIYKRSTFDAVESSTSIGYSTCIRDRGELLHISQYNSLITLNTRTGQVKRHRNIGVVPTQFNWQGDVLWIATDEGVYISQYDAERDNFSPAEVVDESYPDFIPSAVMNDHAGGVWVGYNKGGMCRYELNKRPFAIGCELGNNHISSIFQSESGGVWVGTGGSGLFRLDSIGSQSVSRYVLPSSTIYSIGYSAYNDNLYVATNSKLMKIADGGDGEEEVSLYNSTVRKIIMDGSYMWLALYSGGVIRQDLRDESYVSITTESNLPSNTVRNLMLDSRGDLWICTSQGLAKIDRASRREVSPRVERVLPDSVGGHYAIPIIEDRDGNIWYGTLGYGLFRLRCYEEEKGYELLNITTKDGLKNSVIKSIVEDGDGVVWVSTNRGLSSLTGGEGDVYEIHNYDIDYGLQDYEFNELSGERFDDGTLVFGGVSGFNYFNPTTFIADESEARPIITDFKIFEHSIYEDSRLHSVIPRGLHSNEGVNLEYDQNSITIKFAALHFSNATKCKYSYQLDRVDREWVESSDGVREVIYTNLDPGDYTFYLRTANADGVWSDQTLALPITIDYPFWHKWYALLAYAVLLLFVGFLIINYFHNLMERRNAIALADLERRKMQEMLDMRTRFFTNISHEFRTPLTLILTPLQQLMADEDISKSAKWRDLLSTMAHNGDSLMRLINEFLSYTKQESGGLTVQRSRGEFTKMMRTLFEQFRYWAEQRGLRLRYVEPERTMIFSYDQYLMEQVIYNLVSNAIKYTPEGGEITLAVKDVDDYALVTIEDTGCGISESMRDHIFERFYSEVTDASKEVGGTGIGLFLTKSLVELHDGEIWFDTTPQGTIFYVKLPKVCADIGVEDLSSGVVAHISDVDSVTDVDAADIALSTLLIVDDNIELLRVLKDLFAPYYSVITARDGVEGCQVAVERIPDIIISDVMMPRMNGLELCEKLKSDATTSHIPIILLSAKSSSEDVAAGYRNSADAYCPKPFSNEVLIENVNSILINRRKLASRMSAVGSGGDSLHIVDYDGDATTNTDKMFLRRLTEYIDDNIHNPELVVNNLCNYMGVTPLALNKKLKSLLNMTANALIRTIRLRRAAALLKTSRYTVADVTYDVGFSDLRYFRECFKREFGVLPQEYKDQALNGVEPVSVRAASKCDAIIDAVTLKSDRMRGDRDDIL